MNVYKKIIAVVTAVIIMSVPVLLLVMPKKDFSENENRVLQEKPEYNIENLISGQLSKDIESYANDHFPFRDKLVSMKTTAQKLIGYREMNGVFIAKNRLLQHIEKPDDTKIIERVNMLCDNLAEEDVNINLMMLPTNAEVYKELLPEHAPDIVDEKSVISNIYSNVKCGTIEMTEPLEAAKINGKNLYYNLDHHWNFYGAYVGYEQFCKKTGKAARPIEYFNPKSVSSNFKGSLYSKVLLDLPADEVIAPQYKSDIIVDYYDRKEIKNTYYDEKFLSRKDKYSYFGGGNQALMTIENKDSDNDNEIVIVKDSFANCFIPFIIDDYKKIHVIDPRYYRPHISGYIKNQKNVTDVLLLYNIDSLNINNGIAKIK